MLLSLLLLASLSPKAPSHVEMLDTQTVLVVYTDTSMAVGPLSSFTPTGLPIPGALMTEMPPAGTDNVTKWTDANGLEHEVRTGCATLTPVDCAILHSKYVKAMLDLYPAKP